jgi:hypothetical protein
MIVTYNESLFFKSFEEKLKKIDDLLVKLEMVRQMVGGYYKTWAEDKNRKNLRKLNNNYEGYFAIRQTIIKKFIKIIKNDDLNQNDIDEVIFRWKEFEKNLSYGSYNIQMLAGYHYAEMIIGSLNNFLKSLSDLKKEFNVDCDTEDKFVLSPIVDDKYVPLRRLVHKVRMEKMKNSHINEDPYGEEIWEDEENK